MQTLAFYWAGWLVMSCLAIFAAASVVMALSANASQLAVASMLAAALDLAVTYGLYREMREAMASLYGEAPSSYN